MLANEYVGVLSYAIAAYLRFSRTRWASTDKIKLATWSKAFRAPEGEGAVGIWQCIQKVRKKVVSMWRGFRLWKVLRASQGWI